MENQPPPPTTATTMAAMFFLRMALAWVILPEHHSRIFHAMLFESLGGTFCQEDFLRFSIYRHVENRLCHLAADFVFLINLHNLNNFSRLSSKEHLAFEEIFKDFATY